jgi:Carboxypeptidase regulatory-like domain
MRSHFRYAALVCAAAAALAWILSAAPARAYQAETVKHGGTIMGTVKFAGPPPERARIDVSKDRSICAAVPHYDQSLIVSPDRSIANAVVSIPRIKKGAPLTPLKGVKFDQEGCEYVPHVIAFPAGSTVDIINSDGILHSIRTDSRLNPPLSMAQPGFKKVIPVTLKKPEIIHVTCDVHNWMHGWWFVAGNPYYAVTGANGSFTINNVPPGTYVLKVWQEKLGTATHKVTVEPGKKVSVDFTMGPEKK